MTDKDYEKKFTDDLAVGPQPDREKIKSLAESGFRSVINFRTQGEEDQPIDPGSEEEIVKECGMEYLHIPVSKESMNDEQVDLFRERLENLPKPIYLHCKSGMRSGAFAMMHLACRENMTGDKALEKAEDMGFECGDPQIAEFVKEYVNRHRHQAA